MALNSETPTSSTGMRALVVYDSVFGNTEMIAQAMGKALEPHGAVKVLKVTEVKLEQMDGVELLIVGSPTRAFRPTGAITKLLKRIPKGGLQGAKVAAFDTRVSLADANSSFLNVMVKFFGYAAKPIANRLTGKGGELSTPPEGFFVEGTEGPLKEGELERAAEWARQVASTR